MTLAANLQAMISVLNKNANQATGMFCNNLADCQAKKDLQIFHMSHGKLIGKQNPSIRRPVDPSIRPCRPTALLSLSTHRWLLIDHVSGLIFLKTKTQKSYTTICYLRFLLPFNLSGEENIPSPSKRRKITLRPIATANDYSLYLRFKAPTQKWETGQKCANIDYQKPNIDYSFSNINFY